MSAALWNAMRGKHALIRVRERLDSHGGWHELRIVDGMSAAELEVLVKLEMGWGPHHVDGSDYLPVPQRNPQTGRGVSPTSSQGLTPGSPQADRGQMAA